MTIVFFAPFSISNLFFQVDKYISVSKLKYYFAVDTSYVAKKLLLIAFPFTHQVCNFRTIFFFIS